MESEHLEGELYKVLPAINTAGSDSAMLDNTLEFMVMSGMPLPLAVMITIPEPWAQNATMSQKIKDFYQFTPDDVKLEGYQTGEQIKDIPIAI